MARGLNVFVNIGAKLSGSLNSSASAAERRVSAMTRRMRVHAAEVKAAWVGADKAIGGFGRNFRNFSTGASLPAAGVVALGVRAEYQWQAAGNALEASLDILNNFDSKKARGEIEAIARSLPGNGAENLAAAVDLARTGFNAEAIKGSLRTTVLLAKSDPDSVDTKSASDIMTNVMTSMQVPMGNAEQTMASASRIANLLAYGANKSSSDVRLMGESFKYAAPLATRLGLSAEQLTGIFMTMADAGIKGSESGVALRSAMVRMMRPTKAAMAVLARHNMDMRDYVTMSAQPTGDSIIKSLKAQGLAADGASGAIQRLLDDKSLTGEDLTSKITEAVVAGLGEAGSAMDRDLIASSVAEAMMAGASKVDILKFMMDAQGKFTPADIANFFDARQGARLATLTDGRLSANVADATNNAGGFLERAFGKQQQGIVGGWQRMIQSFGKVLGSLEKAGVFDALADGMERLAAAITWMAEKHPGLTKFLAGAVAMTAGLGVFGTVLGAIGSGLKVIWGVAKFLGVGGLIGRIFGPVGKLGPRVPILRQLGQSLMRLGPRIGPMLLAGLRLAGPWVARGLAAAFGILSGPIGWAILAASAASIAWTYRDEIAKAWHFVVDWFTTSAWPAVKETASAMLDWGGQIVDNIITGLGNQWGRLKSWFAAKWAELTPNFMGGGAPAATDPMGGVTGGRAGGGSVMRGHWYRYNENGGEMFMPGRSGVVIPARASAALLAAATAFGGAPATATASQPTIGELHIHGANDPQSTRQIVREEFARMARSQRGALND